MGELRPAAAAATDGTPWFGRHVPARQSRITLFCFPFSGGGASTYNRWRPLFPPHIDLTPVHLPGREDRLAETDGLSAEPIARALAERIDRPYAIYGHSMGARLGFEVVRSLRNRGIAPPVRFYPAACPPPEVPNPASDCVDLPDDPFIEVLIEQFGALKELRDIPELRQLMLPVIRRDLQWSRDYQYTPDNPLPTAIVALAGEADLMAQPHVMAGWSRHGNRFELRVLPGGHLFLNTDTARVVEILSGDLTHALER